MIDARVSAEVIELYRALIAEADRSASPSVRKRNEAMLADASQTANRREADFLPGQSAGWMPLFQKALRGSTISSGSSSRKPKPRHKIEIDKLSAHLAQTEARHKSQVEELSAHLAQTEARHKSEVEKLNAHFAQAEVRNKTEVAQTEKLERENRQLTLHLARQDGRISEMEVGVMRHEKKERISSASSGNLAFTTKRSAQSPNARLRNCGNHLAQTEARHKSEVEELNAHLALTEARHKSKVEELSSHLALTEARHKSKVEELSSHLALTEARHKSKVEELSSHLALTEARHKSKVEELSTRYSSEVEQLRDRIVEMNQLLHAGSINLAESEARGDDLRNRLRQQLKATRKLSPLLDEADDAASRLRSSARWQIANPVAALKAKLSPSRSRRVRLRASGKDRLGLSEVANRPSRGHCD